MATIVIASPKGGAGKTTTAVLLATELAFSGADVTILDCDPNRSISFAQHRAIQRSLQEQGVTVIKPPLMERSAFSAIFTYGGDLRSMPKQGRMDKAIENAHDFTKFVYKLLMKEKDNESRFSNQGRRHPDYQEENPTFG